jgi:glucosamine--fructose-6-phosphate aminotransferase (isomerizing)
MMMNTHNLLSGIFGYINYLVEKDRRFIIDTLLNGKWLKVAQ